METIDSNGVATCDMMSTSSSHATAGSSCHSVPTSVLMDHLRDANQGSFSFNTPDPYPFSTSTDPDRETPTKPVDVPEDLIGDLDITTIKEEEEPSTPMSITPVSPPSHEALHDPPLMLPDPIAMDISELDVALGELINQILGEGQDLAWLQKQVLEACHVKFNFETKRLRFKVNDMLRDEGVEVDEATTAKESPLEVIGPIPYHYTRKFY